MITPPPRSTIPGEHSLAQPERRGDVDGEHALPLVFVALVDRSDALADSRVIAQEVDDASRCGDQPVAILLLPDVRDEGGDVREVVPQLRERLLVDVTRRDARSRAVEHPHERRPHAPTASAGDEDALALQAHRGVLTANCIRSWLGST
jgi:hypothetical protein